MFSKCGTVQVLGTTITNENLIQEEIKRRLNSGNFASRRIRFPPSACFMQANGSHIASIFISTTTAGMRRA
jgi:hypothetical protein